MTTSPYRLLGFFQNDWSAGAKFTNRCVPVISPKLRVFDLWMRDRKVVGRNYWEKSEGNKGAFHSPSGFSLEFSQQYFGSNDRKVEKLCLLSDSECQVTCYFKKLFLILKTEAKENNRVFTPLSRDGTHFRVIIEPEIETKNDALYPASFSKTKNELPHILQLHHIIDIQYLV